MTPTRGFLLHDTSKPRASREKSLAGLLTREQLESVLGGLLVEVPHPAHGIVLVRLSVTPGSEPAASPTPTTKPSTTKPSTAKRPRPKPAADATLRALQRSCAERLAAHLQEGDALAHLGGLEFAALLRIDEHPDEIMTLAHSLLEAFDRPLLARLAPIQASATAGVAMYPQDGHSARDLLAAAEQAADRARGEAPGPLVFSSPELDAEEQWAHATRTGLGPALERGELVLHYQPVLDLRRGDVAAVEALIRWQHPQRGLVPPLRFIPTAEHTGQIVAIGRWALLEACRQASAWEREGMPVRMAVNLSVREFSAPDLIDHVEAALGETGLDADRLELELTESMFADPISSTVVLRRLHDLGVRVAIDDFGTGFSSLSYLTCFPLDTIKLDRSFIEQAGHDSDAAAIVSSVITMAHELNLKAVAEGVETREQEQMLVDQGCDLLQGFLHSPPLPAADCERWLRQRLGRPLTALPGGGDLSGARAPAPRLRPVSDRDSLRVAARS